MFFTTILFFGIIAIISSIFVITARNPVHSVLALVATYAATCGIMILLGVEFLALLFMIVYVGAIAILFLFVVMMLNIKLEELKDNATRYVPIGLIIGIVFILEVLFILESEIYFSPPTLPLYTWVNPSNNVSTIGAVLYTDFWLWMILASLILLVAMIGAIVLTLQHHNISNVRRQDIFGQLAATSTTSLTMNNNS